MVFKYITGVIVFSQIFSAVTGQNSPAERCAAMYTGTVCTDCTHTDTCNGGILGGSPSACIISGQICDSTISDGTCLTPTTSDLSPICFCKEEGCFNDPNDSEAYVHCTGLNVAANSAPENSCDYTSQQFNVNTCECEEKICPECGWIAGDNSLCPTTFFYCQDSSEPFTFKCSQGLCFDISECHCMGPSIECPDCERYPDPDSTDERGFCVCGENIEGDNCGINCIQGTTFDADACVCSDAFLTTETVGTTSTISTTSTTSTTSTASTISSTSTVSSTSTTSTAFTITPYVDPSESTENGHVSTTSSMEVSTISTANTTPLTIVCQDCGRGKGQESDCSVYYTCNEDGSIIKRYECPNNQCFNEDLCGCF